MAMPPQFMKKAPAKGGKPAAKAAGKAPAKGGKMRPGCKNPMCKRTGKCAKG